MLFTGLISFINLLIRALGGIASLLMNLLPPSPFQAIQFSSIPYLDTLNWVIPIDVFITILTTWLGAIVLYYVVQVGLRWIKAIE